MNVIRERKDKGRYIFVYQSMNVIRERNDKGRYIFVYQSRFSLWKERIRWVGSIHGLRPG
jgi:hypothetical protein